MSAVAAPLPWPETLAGAPAVAVIERALERGRLGHGLLLHGDDLELLNGVAHALADRLLHLPDPVARSVAARFPPETHPDCFALRPAGKLRQISANPTRDLIALIQQTPRLSTRKVAIVYEADRMHPSAANIFLKTLEEPPLNTTILLLSAKPYALLPTIRSRCLQFRFPAPARPFEHPLWPSWLDDYRAWLGRLTDGVKAKDAVCDEIFTLYGLVTRFASVLGAATDAAWKEQKGRLPDTLTEEELAAAEKSLSVGLQQRLFADIERSTRDFAFSQASAGEEAAAMIRRPLAAAVRELERVVRLLRLNFNEQAALEEFLLVSLRLWAKK